MRLWKRWRRLYSEAYRQGSRSPTKDVASRMGIPYGMAGKLVMRCRAVGLLEATAPRKAGGIKPERPGTDQSKAGQE